MVYTLFGSWQLSGNYRIGEFNYPEKITGLTGCREKSYCKQGIYKKNELPDFNGLK